MKEEIGEIQHGSEEQYMRMALEEAEKALKKGEIPIGAVLVFKGKVLARAHNMPISLNDPTAHAEILVLREAALKMGNYRLPNTSLYVTVEPCVMCIGALVQARIEKLTFGVFDLKSGACGSVYDIPSSPGILHKMTVVSGILEEECRRIIQEFFKKKRQGKDT
ncbi:MAG: tRNA adenosine(34) deaminase TadA [Deltaproteobacteria bacterium]|jgi:tRNA(adenine34) deaminase|nr:tRNA adenosine(34) deaminase TadA [Deltaproteobacteria bacterium]MBW2183578.1 tRNA adenosine(34) deaminase TadA [Deltaproteobacteria bacterium]RLB25252.1 MAG: tRNA adenosine(34) deaminase TadA [Deltaproteobacteria bacterium]